MYTKPISAVIVDNEPGNRSLIAAMLEGVEKRFKVCGMAAGVEEGKAIINETQPSVVFVDISMRDGTGFDLLNAIAQPGFETVFITANDQYALKAFEFNALDYLLKPIDVNRFKKTLDRVYRRVTQGSGLLKEKKNNPISNEGVVKKIPVHYRDQVWLFEHNEIESLSAEGGCTILSVSGKGKFTSSKQLSDFEDSLVDSACFAKLNRKTYINLNHIANYTKGSYCSVTMNSQDVFEVSRRHKSMILDLLTKAKAY
jgi:two-component system LytT family response regulator